MKKSVIMISVLAIMAAGVCISVAADEAKAQTKCPVMGGIIDKKQFADFEGKRVYFCCAGCSDKFNKEPAKYIKKLEDSGVTLEKTPGKDDKADAKTSSTPAKKAGCGKGCCG